MSSEEKNSGEKHPDEKNIGRRTFLGLVLAGVVAFVFGKDVIPGLVTGSSPSVTTVAGGGSTGTASGGTGTTKPPKSPTEGFRINTAGDIPAFDPATWKLTVDGLVGTPLTFTFDEFTALPQTTIVRDFYCVEGWGVTGVEWKGVALSELMKRAQPGAKATHLLFHSSDGVYTDSLTMAEAATPDAVLAHQINGVPLPSDMGQPVRLIWPGHYGYKYVKWVERVQVLDIKEDPFIGYWESYGYTADASIP